MNYLQKKKQAIIMMLAAQIIKTAQGYPVAINDCESGTAVDYTVWGNTETGKNLFDTQGWYNWLRTFTTEYVSKTEVDGISCIYYRPNATYDKQYMKGQFKENTQYTISFRAKGIVGTGISTTFKFMYADGKYSTRGVANKDEWNSYTIVSTANKTIDHIEMMYNYAQGCYFDENSIQLEEGAAATEYEPYTESYVGDKTLVSDNTYKYKIPIVNSGKNLLPYPYYESTKTVNGITFTNNGDGSVTVSGTATEYVAFNFVQALPCRPNQTYTVVKNGVDVNNVSFVFCDVNENGKITRETVSTTREKTFTVTTLASTAYIKLLMKRQNNAECTGTVKPTLELGTTATEYEPYRAPVTASIYLDEPLKNGESVNFGADNLPELQLFEGSNVITADTAVKPEKISVDYYEKG